MWFKSSPKKKKNLINISARLLIFDTKPQKKTYLLLKASFPYEAWRVKMEKKQMYEFIHILHGKASTCFPFNFDSHRFISNIYLSQEKKM